MDISKKKIYIWIINAIGIILGLLLYTKSFLIEQQIFVFLALWYLGVNFLFIKYKIIKIISAPILIGAGFLLLLAYCPLFYNEPDTTGFSSTQQTEFTFIGNYENEEIIDKTEFGEQKIRLVDSYQKIILPENSKRTIIVNQKTEKPNEKDRLIISFSNNTIYIVYPGSKITIEKQNNIYTLTKDYGTIEYYIPNNNKEIVIKKSNSQEKKSKSDFSEGSMIQEYENRERTYIIDQAGGQIMMQPVIQKLSKNIIDIAYKIRPKIYENNKKNYEKYKDILGRKEEKNTYATEDNRRNIMKNQINKGRQETLIIK